MIAVKLPVYSISSDLCFEPFKQFFKMGNPLSLYDRFIFEIVQWFVLLTGRGHFIVDDGQLTGSGYDGVLVPAFGFHASEIISDP